MKSPPPEKTDGKRNREVGEERLLSSYPYFKVKKVVHMKAFKLKKKKDEKEK